MPSDMAPTCNGRWSKASRGFEGSRASHHLLAEVCPAYRLRAHEHVRFDGTLRIVGVPDTNAEAFRESWSTPRMS